MTVSTDWHHERLADLGRWIGGGTPSKKNAGYWTDGDVPWVSPKDMKAHILAGSADHITRAAVRETVVKVAPENSVALVVRSGILEHTLPVALVPFSATFNQDMRVVTPREDVDPRWLLYALLADAETIRRTCQKDGTTVASINVPQLMDYELAVPLLSEQREIVAWIETTLTAVDAAVEEVGAAGALAYRLAEAAVDEALRGYPDVPFGDLVTGLRYGTSVKCTADASGAAVLRIPNVRGGRLDTTDLKYATVPDSELGDSFVQEGDLLFVRTNGSRDLIGRVAVVDSPDRFAFASYLIRARVDPSLLDSRFAVLALSSRRLRRDIESRAATSAGQYNLNTRSLRALPFPLPTLDVQRGVVATLARRLGDQELALDDLEEARSLVSDLRAAVLRTAVTSRLPDKTGRPDQVVAGGGV